MHKLYTGRFRLIELQEEKGNTEFALGDIYLGKVRKVVPSLNAAFVDVALEKDACWSITLQSKT